MPCRLGIDTGGKQSKKEDGRKRVQAETKAHCRRQLDVAAAHAAVFHGQEKKTGARQQKSRNPLGDEGETRGQVNCPYFVNMIY